MPKSSNLTTEKCPETGSDCDVTLVAKVLNTPRLSVNSSQTQKNCIVTSPNLAFCTALRMKVVEKKQTKITM